MPLTSPRSVVVTLFTAIALVASSATAVSAAPPLRDAPAASSAPVDATVDGDEPDGLPQLGEHDPADYVDEAADLPTGLVDAIERDLDSTPEEYLAAADATHDAGTVIDALADAGIDILGSRLEGTELVVNVQDAAEAAIVESTGATAELGAPEPIDLPDATMVPAVGVDVYGGQGYFLTDNMADGLQCSVAFPGYSISSGAARALTAGHCLKGKDGWSAYQIIQNNPGLLSGPGASVGDHIGSPLSGSAYFGSRYDSALLKIDSGDQGAAAVVTWNGGAGNPFATTPLPVWGEVVALVNSPICKSGSRTGWTCGTVNAVDTVTEYGNPGPPTVNTISADGICVRPGDSGGAALIGNYAVGIVSGSDASAAGCTPEARAVFFPMMSNKDAQSVARKYTNWELAVTVATPVVDPVQPTVTRFDTISGTLDHATEGSTVSLRIDGALIGTADASDGTWSIPLTTAAIGTHGYEVVGGWGVHSISDGSVTGTIDVEPVGADRLDAPDSIALAALISSQTFPVDVDTVYITGAGSWRAPSAVATAAATAGAPMLLVRSSVTSEVSTELLRLNPAHIVVVGSTTTVPSSVFTALAGLVPSASIARWSAPGWPSLSRTVADRVFHTAATAFVVTYKTDDDALATASAAGLLGAPLLFVDGTASSVPSETIARLQSLGVDDVYVVGSTARVSSAIKAQIDAMPGVMAHRISGSDAFDMSRRVNTAFASDFSGSAAYLAYGGTSLGGALAAAVAVPDGVPVYLTRSYCVPVSTIAKLSSSGHTDLTLVGSTSELSDAVGIPTAC